MIGLVWIKYRLTWVSTNQPSELNRRTFQIFAEDRCDISHKASFSQLKIANILALHVISPFQQILNVDVHALQNQGIQSAADIAISAVRIRGLRISAKIRSKIGQNFFPEMKPKFINLIPCDCSHFWTLSPLHHSATSDLL